MPPVATSPFTQPKTIRHTVTTTANQKPPPNQMLWRSTARRSATFATGFASWGRSENSGTSPARISGTRFIFTKGWMMIP